MIDTLIFDLGGTLIEYAGTYEQWPELETPGFAAAYTHLQSVAHLPPFQQFCSTGFALLPTRWQQAVKRERNLTLVTLLEEVLANLNITAVPPHTLAQAARHYEQAICNQAWLIPHAQETVATLKKQGYQIGLISNTMFTGAAHRQDLVRFGLFDHFDAMLFSADENKWKPNAETFIHVLDALKRKAKTAVFIGDDPASDVVGGHNIGMKTIYFPSSQRFAPPDGIKPTAQINTLTELPHQIANL